MAVSAQAALLDELMGRNRNLGANDPKKAESKWDDIDICTHYLCAFCPHDLFTNTKADLGRCNKIHDDDMKKDYLESSRCGTMGYEKITENYFTRIVNDVDRKIRRGHERLEMNAALALEKANSTNEERITMLTTKITELVQQAEELGCQGDVEEAQGVMKLCDQLSAERTLLEQPNTLKDKSIEYDQEMEVCDICGAMVVADVQQRIDEHLMGKQHMGIARIRAHLESMKDKRGETTTRLVAEHDARETDREAERERRRKEWEAANPDRKKEQERRDSDRKRHDGERRDRHETDRRDRHGHSSSSKDDRRHTSHHDRHRRSHRSRSRDRHHSSSHHRSSRDSKRRSRSRHRSKERHRHSNDKEHRKESRESNHVSNSTSTETASVPEQQPDHQPDPGPEDDVVLSALTNPEPEVVKPGFASTFDSLDE